MYLTGLNQREMYGQSYHVKDEITIGDLAARTTHVVSREMDVVRSQLSRNRVTILSGTGSFADPHTIQVDDGVGPDPHRHRGQDRDRHRHPPGPAGQRGVRRAHRHRLRRDREPGERAALDAGGRRRRDRHRVRLHVRRPGDQGHRGGAARADARVLRRRGGRGAQVPPARPRRHVPVRRDGVLGRVQARGGHRHLAEREEDPRRHGPVLGRPAGRQRPPQPGGGRADRRQARPDRGRRLVPDRGAAHLRGGRRDRVPGAGRHLDGAGPARRPPRLRRPAARGQRPAADRHLQHSRDQLRGPDRGAADQGQRAVRGGRLPLP